MIKTKMLAVAAVCGTALLAAAPAFAGTLAGTYDGHCDGFSLTTTASGAAYGFETGCETGAIAGAKVKGGAVINEPHLAGAVFKISSKDHTFTIYSTTGSIIEMGTWTAVAPGAAPRALSGLHPSGTR